MPAHVDLDVTEEEQEEVTGWGCWSQEANDDVDAVVDLLVEKIKNKELRTPEAIVSQMAYRMSEIGDGATDTVVKESVAGYLKTVMEENGIPKLGMSLYGW